MIPQVKPRGVRSSCEAAPSGFPRSVSGFAVRGHRGLLASLGKRGRARSALFSENSSQKTGLFIYIFISECENRMLAYSPNGFLRVLSPPTVALVAANSRTSEAGL